MVKVTIKWGKKLYPSVDLDVCKSVLEFKTSLETLTCVPVQRQKLMAKGLWKGILKDDDTVAFSILKEKSAKKEEFTIMLMGSAETVKVPEKKTIFLEDMTSEEMAETGIQIPSGLSNLGNTCYMNATLQCLRFVPELRSVLGAYSANPSSDLANNLTLSLRDSFSQMDGSTEAHPPVRFLEGLRMAFPQFAQQGRGGFMQQDSDEFVSSVFSTLSQKLVTPTKEFPDFGPHNNAMDALFGLEMEETLTCSESDAEPPIMKKEKALKLVCNITKDINHVSEGIKLGLDGTIEKESQILGRNSVWKKTSKINELPKFLCVQFMRFYWKLTPDSRDHTGVKCKMMRPISFPLILDVYDICSDDLKKVLSVGRLKRADEILNSDAKKEAEKKSEETKATKSADALTEKMDVEEVDEDAKALETAMAMSVAPARSAGVGLPFEFMGNYELFAVVTHKGRSADSGHYIGWAKAEGEGDDWFCFDDDDVSACKSEDILKLKGGGDWHMNYLTFYRAKN